MKKSNRLRIQKILLFLITYLLSFSKVISNTLPALPSRSKSLVEPPSLNIDTYLIPMLLLGILYGCYFIKKKLNN